jgi:GT2 family glycosyltransferase
MPDLAVVIVSYNSRSWLGPCLRSLYEMCGDVRLDVVVVDNGSTDGSPAFVEREFPRVRVLRRPNRGFAAGNNAALESITAPHILFLNPDTEIREGAFGDLLDLFDDRPSLGLIGCRQVAADGTLHPTIRRFPTLSRYLFTSLGSERLPFHWSWLGERVRNWSMYNRDVPCDWTSGSYMLARREAIDSVDGFDERYFLFSEETDLCFRLKRAGWEIRHSPRMTIVHHAGKAGFSERLSAQDAYARRQYVIKNLPPLRGRLALAAYGLGHVLRTGYMASDSEVRVAKRRCARRCLRTLYGLVPPPFGEVRAVGGDAGEE